MPEPKTEPVPEPKQEQVFEPVEIPDDFDPFLYEDELMDDGVIGLTPDDGVRKFIFQEGLKGK